MQFQFLQSVSLKFYLKINIQPKPMFNFWLICTTDKASLHQLCFYLSGFFVSLDNIPSYMQWMSYIAYVRYGFEGTMLSIYGYDRETLECSQAYCHFKYPKKFLEEMALDKGVFWIDVVALLAFFVVLRVSGYFILRFKVKMEK